MQGEAQPEARRANMKVGPERSEGVEVVSVPSVRALGLVTGLGRGAAALPADARAAAAGR